VGSLYAGAPYYATFTHATWYNTFLYSPSGGIPWPVGGWQGAGDYAISNDLPTPELKSSETEPDVMAVEFSRDVSDVTIRGLDLGYAGAEVDIFDVNGQLLGSGQFTGTGAGNNQFHDFSFPGISGVRRLEFYQVHDLSGDGDLYQALTYTVNDCP
jgi:hypothetical protein